ncbi:hypothetical protein Kfla_1353 [Kribbella flavida DSM 17836]|uniref:DUF998 domain-containing protein n=1 Tax=Kribbella flavida (strain DSM 17836 / JCM 10339 / NBRC 14399) TaxID=479435 RepID=D2PKE3_KRIFD|nr:DUF998 domain-containing protein [Kribbella flavida]ADB30455.1 hypothetical protein Kfla_1353 [Kribbella flavida DSM 17836]
MDRLTKLGATAWAVGVTQFFVLMVVVQLSWKTRYSWADNNISDLGNVHCGDFGGRYVCSPLHGLMNGSFVVGGVLIIAGVLLTYAAWPRGVASWTVRVLLMATGSGWMVAGLSPADINEDLHVLGGAVVIFLGGNLALLLAGLLRPDSPISRTRWYAVGFGLLGLVAMVLHFGGHGLGLGTGGMERVTAYGVPVWLLIAALTLLRPTPSRRESSGARRRRAAVRR